MEGNNLTTLKITIDYLHGSKDDKNAKKHDELINALIRVVKSIKAFNS